MKNIVKPVRQYFAERERAAFTTDQVREGLVNTKILQDKPELSDVFKAVDKLVDLGHLTSRKDPDDESIVYQVTPAGIAVHKAT